MYKFWQVLFFALILIALVQAQFVFNSGLCTGKSDGFYCKSCKELILCPSGVGLTCGALDNTRPYCNGTKPGHATCQEGQMCPVESSARIVNCERTGRFPDSLFCEVYHQCSREGEKAEQYSCPPGTQFDAKREICYKPTKADNLCYTFQANNKNGLCRGKPLSVIAHPIRPDVYVTCDGVYDLKMCKSKYEEYDPKIDSCVFKCKKDGFFAAPEKDRFTTCVLEAPNVWVQYIQSCVAGTEFKEYVGHCASNVYTTTNYIDSTTPNSAGYPMTNSPVSTTTESTIKK